jgi:CRISPR-associated protein Csb1
MDKITIDVLKEAISGKYAAIRRITRLEPLGEKVFPPTYEGGEYADEQRVVKNEKGELCTVETVLLDSVQSQANRMEIALLHAYDSGRIKMPMLLVDFAKGGDDPILKEVGRITALEAPHRVCDAIFRDAMLSSNQRFRESDFGKKLEGAKAANATGVFELCPTALIFGFWDSTGPRGGLGAKLQRAVVSEIIGYQSVLGKRTSSRIDPLQIENNLDIYKKVGGGWTFEASEAEKGKNGDPVKLRPSEANHSNIVPSFRHEDQKTRKPVLNHGGVTLAYAEQHTVLSLAAMRRLRFPLNGVSSSETDLAARTVLTALGMAAICLLDDDGHDLRSRCLLDGKPGRLEFVGRGEKMPFELDSKDAILLLSQAVEYAKSQKLPWCETPIELVPTENLARLVVESRRRSMNKPEGA